MPRRIFAMMPCLCMVFSMLPLSVFAEGAETEINDAQTQETTQATEAPEAIDPESTTPEVTEPESSECTCFYHCVEGMADETCTLCMADMANCAVEPEVCTCTAGAECLFDDCDLCGMGDYSACPCVKSDWKDPSRKPKRAAFV